MRTLSILLSCVLLCVITPAISASPTAQVHAYVEISGHRFSVEIADTDAAREHGLMFRTRLATDHGMLFVYPDAQVRLFWMKHTLISLDILFFDAHKRLINISTNTPPCKTVTCPTYASAAPAQYVLELKAGTTRKSGIKPGAVLTLSP